MSSKIIKPEGAGGTGTGVRNIIEKEVLLAHAEARRVIEEAEEQARQRLAEAEEKAGAVLAQAEKEGHERSLADWQSRLAGLADERRRVLEAARPQILQLAVRVAEKILRLRLESDPEALYPLVEETLETVRASPGQQITLRVHPDDQGALAELRERLIRRHRRWESLTVEKDAAAARGSCRVETDFGTLDAGLDTQLRAIEKLLLEGEG